MKVPYWQYKEYLVSASEQRWKIKMSENNEQRTELAATDE